MVVLVADRLCCIADGEYVELGLARASKPFLGDQRGMWQKRMSWEVSLICRHHRLRLSLLTAAVEGYIGNAEMTEQNRWEHEMLPTSR